MLSSPYLAVEPEAVARFLAEVRKRARLHVSFEDLARWLQESHELPAMRAALEGLQARGIFFGAGCCLLVRYFKADTQSGGLAVRFIGQRGVPVHEELA